MFVVQTSSLEIRVYTTLIGILLAVLDSTFYFYCDVNLRLLVLSVINMLLNDRCIMPSGAFYCVSFLRVENLELVFKIGNLCHHLQTLRELVAKSAVLVDVAR